ncbi:hypothetical protein BBJ29_009183 [Phytophthora kernoviae]|uniref:PWWP domain-containing protein n=1 Tax=Phytophthora kernoviae TaxID=325452 RepID=A0A3F2RYL5_9STRA|nr:hypothetical protein BBJ29_009183 [Phytophthora kernoviae]RLN66709.1 hypothetical protein BBP00_00002053 [Phytophthora kernoviae]
MSELAAAAEAPADSNSPPVVDKTEEKGKEVSTDATAAAEKKPEAVTPRKRRTSSPRVSKKTDAKPEDEEDTESEPEKQPKKRAKTTKTPKKTPGRKKKAPEPEPLSEDEEQRQVELKVLALADEIKSKFGQVVWAKMGGYPYWPCIITDPRLLPKKLQDPAMKVLDTKYLVYFYVTNNFAPVSFKLIETWDDTKNNYREGHPEKDSKAPKRRVNLMKAIELADKEVKLPTEERADGLLKPEERPKPDKEGGDEADQSADANMDTQEDDEDAAGPTLSKDEIKAKVASRKTPSKKKAAEDTANVSGASAKKPTVKQGKSNGSAHKSGTEIDSKRKKEIELVVPHKTVKSADIREMTEEAAKKKLGGSKSKAKKDKGDYKVGDLGSYASKMARLHAKESARNNDELVAMMQELFQETMMYRSDVERSGLAAIIAILRKNLSPTVGQAASALRKHLMKILNNDTEEATSSKKNKSGTHYDVAGNASKKRKVENGSSVKTEDTAQKPPPDAVSSAVDNSDKKDNSMTKDSPPANASPEKKTDAASAKDTSPKEETSSNSATDVTTKTDDATDNPKRSPSPNKVAKSAEGAKEDDIFQEQEHLDKNREIFVDMLSQILDHDGSKRADLAKEIEATMFERFKESNADYLTQARIIIFGLKENSTLRERLASGNMHCLELAYADDSFFKTTE